MKTIIDCTTGEITKRELNADELKQQTIDEAIVLNEKTEAEAKVAAKAAAQAKLAAFGLTVEDLQALGL
jgi:hypothetical protein